MLDGSPGGANEICGLQAAYGIPPNNPFVGTGDGCDEIWMMGVIWIHHLLMSLLNLDRWFDRGPLVFCTNQDLFWFIPRL